LQGFEWPFEWFFEWPFEEHFDELFDEDRDWHFDWLFEPPFEWHLDLPFDDAFDLPFEHDFEWALEALPQTSGGFAHPQRSLPHADASRLDSSHSDGRANATAAPSPNRFRARWRANPATPPPLGRTIRTLLVGPHRCRTIELTGPCGNGHRNSRTPT
jgi:hypothetical protein